MERPSHAPAEPERPSREESVRVRARGALDRLRAAAKRSPLAKMTDDEIDAEIAATRADRRAKSSTP